MIHIDIALHCPAMLLIYLRCNAMTETYKYIIMFNKLRKKKFLSKIVRLWQQQIYERALELLLTTNAHCVQTGKLTMWNKKLHEKCCLSFEFQQHRVIWEFLIWIIHWGRQGETNAHSAQHTEHRAACTQQHCAIGTMVWGQLRLMQAFPAFSDAPRYTALYQLFFKHSPNPQNCTTCSLYSVKYTLDNTSQRLWLHRTKCTLQFTVDASAQVPSDS